MPKGGHVRVYEGFLELPVPVVLALMWMAGAALLGAVVTVAYSAAMAIL
jgi:hypothetical protein